VRYFASDLKNLFHHRLKALAVVAEDGDQGGQVHRLFVGWSRQILAYQGVEVPL